MLQPDNPDAFNVWHVHGDDKDLIFVKGAHAISVISWLPFYLWCFIHINNCPQNYCACFWHGHQSHQLTLIRPRALIYRLNVVITT